MPRDVAGLIEGYHRFRSEDWASEKAEWETLAKGQKPKVLVIACSDSRVDPTQIFDAKPGELFVIRNVANLVPPFETGGGYHGVSAALEFAVTQLKVGEILIMGHASCGGCAAALSQGFKDADKGEGGFVASWISLLDDAREKVVADKGNGPEAQTAMEWEGVRTSIKNLRTFPFVKEREDAGELKLRGAWFGIAEGELRVMQPNEGAFEPA